MSVIPQQWLDWCSGEYLVAPSYEKVVPQFGILNVVSNQFKRVSIDWLEGNRWVDVRIAHGISLGFAGALLDAELALKDNTVYVALSDAERDQLGSIRFFM